MWFDHLQSALKVIPKRLEKNQLEAARIVTDLTSHVSILSIYKETGRGKLSVRREKRKLSLFYDIVSGQSPDYLQDLLPSYFVFEHFLPRRISQVCWQIVPESNSTWGKRTLIYTIIFFYGY
jgi:hypothetical protein